VLEMARPEPSPDAVPVCGLKRGVERYGHVLVAVIDNATEATLLSRPSISYKL
jgi:hypothetical protein